MFVAMVLHKHNKHNNGNNSNHNNSSNNNSTRTTNNLNNNNHINNNVTNLNQTFNARAVITQRSGANESKKEVVLKEMRGSEGYCARGDCDNLREETAGLRGMLTQ
ncbi:hypothetical protein APICC_03120 [Apis cerana cerana]|uniref:Uncharacterized protein n=1 Tax=Apis cerana cerana TaxID=94128 RepID=A0A2A3EDZ8_APICC|nr:hypothetical protein APICC_03120 [Apis cerana cerana]